MVGIATGLATGLEKAILCDTRKEGGFDTTRGCARTKKRRLREGDDELQMHSVSRMSDARKNMVLNAVGDDEEFS